MIQNRPRRILFLCTGNSCRSQMAEGWANAIRQGVVEAYSAGVEPLGLSRHAVTVMAEVGVDISQHHSKTVDELPDIALDHVVTVCDQARESCPVFSGSVKTTHRRFDDPPWLAQDSVSEHDTLSHYRRVRDEIRAFVETLPEALDDRKNASNE